MAVLALEMIIRPSMRIGHISPPTAVSLIGVLARSSRRRRLLARSSMSTLIDSHWSRLVSSHLDDL